MSTQRPGTPFPIAPPIEPMLAKLADTLPAAGHVLFEPKWDGFRAIVFRGASDLFIQSRDLRPLDRYFPELHDALLERLPRDCVVDGEIVIATPHGLDFDALQLRLHPAASRVAKLAKETPASFVAFDLLAADGQSLMEAPQSERRARLERLLAERGAAALPHPHDARPGDRGPVARAVRGRRSGRRDRQAGGQPLPAGQARHDQGEARAHRRLRGGRVPLAQERTGRGRLAAPGSLRRARRAAARRGHVIVHHGDAQAAREGAGAAPRRTRSRIIPGGSGRRREQRASSACPAGRAAGARARISPGSRCASSACAR